VNPSWPKWIQASINTLIKTVIDQSVLPCFADTDSPRPNNSDRLEFSLTGPSFEEVSKDEHRIYCSLAVLVTSVKTDGNDYKLYLDQGVGQKALPTCIPVYKYGAEVADDSTQLGILVRQGRVEVFNIGHQEPSNRVRQVGYIANYRMDL